MTRPFSMGKAGFVFASLMVVVSPSIFNVELRVSGKWFNNSASFEA